MIQFDTTIILQNAKRHEAPGTLQQYIIRSYCRYTRRGERVYAMVLQWPENDMLKLGSVVATQQTHITMLGFTQGSLSVYNKLNTCMLVLATGI